MEDVELLVYLEELEGAASSPPFLFGLPVVDVLSNRHRRPVRSGENARAEEELSGEAEVAYPLVLGGLAHDDDEANRGRGRRRRRAGRRGGASE